MEDNVLAGFAQALVSGSIRVIDLTQPLKAATPVIQLPPEFGKSWPFKLEEISKYDSRGPAWYWNNFSCGEHTGHAFRRAGALGDVARIIRAMRPTRSPSRNSSRLRV